ncbi:MAG TPA: Stp1/IreP family PP2C-type Ser/Thr phosphatase [Pyrinomonadaceae bacterium]|nr:Stp1/IreP family PP2C-type Ser/Thr phosphatase [Pyrinomonadaceae bacterium]
MFKRKEAREAASAVTGDIELPPAHEVVANIQTDRGCVRAANEDSGRFVRPNDPSLLARKGLLAIVADGMGGHSAGEVASRMAVEIVSRTYYGEQGAGTTEALRAAFEEANRRIHEAATDEPELRGMGTTCTALVLHEGHAFSAHVGDSRLYLLRGGEVYLMTEDHSAVMEMVKLGIITHEQARHHTDKNVILRALGTSPEVEVSTWEQPLVVRVGDQFLLCSDGLYDLVSDAEIKQALVATDDLQAACEGLIERAKERGGHDNITVGILSIRPEGQSQIGKRLRETRETEVRQ